MRKIVYLVLFFAFSFQSYGQNFSCGTPEVHEDFIEEAKAFYSRKRTPSIRDRAPREVALTVHMVGLANPPSIESIESAISRTSQIFGPDLNFFLCGSPRVTSGQPRYSFSNSPQLHASNQVVNTINVYIVEEAVSFDDVTPVCGYVLAIPKAFPGDQRENHVIVDNDCWEGGLTLAHELGHFYGLQHTHARSFGTELVNRSNCASAGDFFCDTPADPDLSLPNTLQGCNYVGNYVDPNGEFYAPMVSNVMSYSPDPCQRGFSDEQIALVLEVSDNENSFFNDNCDFYPDFGISTATSDITIRSDEDITIDYNINNLGISQPYDVEITVLLAEEEGASGGLALTKERIQIQPGQETLSKTFALDFPISFGTGTYFLRTTIDSELSVFERTEKNNVAVSRIRVDNSSLNDQLVFPNPVQDQLKMFFRDTRASGPLVAKIYGYDGRLVRTVEGFKNREEYFQLLELGDLDPGFYLIRVDFERVNKTFAFKFLKL